MVDHRLFMNEEFRKAAERCVECPDREECEPFQAMMKGGLVVKHCPKGRPNVI